MPSLAPESGIPDVNKKRRGTRSRDHKRKSVLGGRGGVGWLGIGHAKDVHSLVPRTCDYVNFHDKGTEAEDEIKVIHSLTLKQRDYPGLAKWARGNLGVLECGRRGRRVRPERGSSQKI